MTQFSLVYINASIKVKLLFSCNDSPSKVAENVISKNALTDTWLATFCFRTLLIYFHCSVLTHHAESYRHICLLYSRCRVSTNQKTRKSYTYRLFLIRFHSLFPLGKDSLVPDNLAVQTPVNLSG